MSLVLEFRRILIHVDVGCQRVWCADGICIEMITYRPYGSHYAYTTPIIRDILCDDTQYYAPPDYQRPTAYDGELRMYVSWSSDKYYVTVHHGGLYAATWFKYGYSEYYSKYCRVSHNIEHVWWKGPTATIIANIGNGVVEFALTSLSK